MTDKEKIRAEVEKCISNYKDMLDKFDKTQDGWVDTILMLKAKVDVLEHVIYFIDSLLEEPVSEDLEEEIDKYTDNPANYLEYSDGWSDLTDIEYIEKAAYHFANWQKEKDTRDMLMSDNRNFKKVYDIGKKDMKEKMVGKACEWLRDNLFEYVDIKYPSVDTFVSIDNDALEQNFRKAMEAEK